MWKTLFELTQHSIITIHHEHELTANYRQCTVLDHTQTGLRPILQIRGRLMKLRSTELQIMSWYIKQTTSITSGALVHHLMRPGTGVCIFGLVGDVHSEARCASAPEAAA